MKVKSYILLLFLFCSCGLKKGEQGEVSQSFQGNNVKEVGRKELSDGRPDSVQQIRRLTYFVINREDTSSFKPVFIEYKNEDRLDVLLNISYQFNNISHSQRMAELQTLLGFANSNYPIQYLQNISIGRLYLTGDLAIDVSRQYFERFKHVEQIEVSDYPSITNFLLGSKLTEDFNNLLAPYKLEVAEVAIEKAFFIDSQILDNTSRIDTEKEKIPKRILDCIVYIQLKDKSSENY